MKELFKNIARDIRTELLDEFDRNFERKSFFDKPWKQTKMPNPRGSLMMRTGKLRKGNRATISGGNITFTNSQPYAGLHNEGGEVKVTIQMKKFFWAMHYKASAGSEKYIRGKKKAALSQEAEYWKRMALKKVGSTIKFERRQFIGWHPQVKQAIERVMNDHLKDLEMYIKSKLKRK